jgi:hypothetical protein
VLALVYVAFIAQFLFRSIEWVVQHYPQRAPYLLAMIQDAYFAGHTDVAVSGTFRLIYESMWPLILCVLVCFLVFRVFRFLRRAIKSVMSGYAITISMPRFVYTISAWKARWVRH